MSYWGDYDAYDGDLNPEIYIRPKNRRSKMSEETKVVTGVLEKAFKKDSGLCSIKVGEEWFSTYKDHYPELEGKTVEVTLAKKGKYWNVKGKPAVVAMSASAAKQGGASSASYDDKQNSIVLQSSYKTGAEVLGTILSNGLVSVPTKKADQYDFVLNLLDEIALRIFSRASNATEFVAQEEDPNPAPADDADYNPLEA